MKFIFESAKKSLFFLFLFLLLNNLYSYTDSFSPLFLNDNNFDDLFSSIKNNDEYSITKSAYDKYISSEVGNSEKCRAEYLFSRYLTDSDRDDESKEHVDKAKFYYKSIENGFFKDVAKMEYTSCSFYLSKNLSTGLDNSDIISKLYKTYPDEIYIVINNAWRIIETPAIAGGSNKKGIEMLLPLLEEKEKILPSDLYSLYTALSTAYYNLKKYKEAKIYLDEALSLYNGEPYVIDLKKKIEKKVGV